MAASFIYVSHNKLKAGKLEAYQQDFMPELVKVVDSNEPRLLAFNVFANDEGTEIAGVQVYRSLNAEDAMPSSAAPSLMASTEAQK